MMRRLLILHFTARPFLPYYLVYDDRMGLIYQNWRYRPHGPMCKCGKRGGKPGKELTTP